MLDHHIQQTIVHTLAFSDGMRFSELKPDHLENKAFDYHLKKVIAAKLVAKDGDGFYRLTSEGKRVGKGALKQQSHLIDRAYSLLLLAIRRESDGAWLLYRRQSHPLRGLIGFMQAQPVANASTHKAATQECFDATGLTVDFSVHGHGYFSVYRNDQLESFIHFTLLLAENVVDKLPSDSREYYWDTQPDFSAPDMLPTMKTLSMLCQTPTGGFVDESFQL